MLFCQCDVNLRCKFELSFKLIELKDQVKLKLPLNLVQ